MTRPVLTIRWGHIDREPKCQHGRLHGYCRPCDEARTKEARS
jgi:hypothetical protein